MMLIKVAQLPERVIRVARTLAAAFVYLGSRLTGLCEDQYDESAFYETRRLVQLFDAQQFAAKQLYL